MPWASWEHGRKLGLRVLKDCYLCTPDHDVRSVFAVLLEWVGPKGQIWNASTSVAEACDVTFASINALGHGQ